MKTKHSYVFLFASAALGLGCSSVPTLTFGEVTEQEATEPATCPSGAAQTPTACCETRWCYGDECKCDECIAKCGNDQVCCTKKSGPPANRLTCKPLGEGC